MAEEGIQLFSKISNPNEMILCLLFNSCSQVATKQALDLGCKVWSEMSLVHRRNKYIVTAALNMFITFEDLSSAENLFLTMKPEVIDYGQMMKCYNNQKMPMKTINLHEKMRNEGLQGDSITFILLADACAQIGIKSRCRSIVSQIPHALLPNLQLQTALIHMWVSDV
jgi:pentatricopeptide repeat protein